MADRAADPPRDAPQAPPVDASTLFGAMTEVVLVLSREGRYLWAAPTLAAASERNQQRSDWLMGKTIHEVFGDTAQADRLVNVIVAALGTGETQHIEYMMDVWGTPSAADPDPSGGPQAGGPMWFAASVSRIDNDRVVWVARDVTARVKARETLEEAIGRKTQEMTTMLELSRTLSSTLELDPLLNTLLDQLKTVVPYDGAGVDLIVDDQIHQMAVRRPVGYPTDKSGSSTPLYVSKMTDAFRPLLANEPLLIRDTHDDTAEAEAYRAIWGGDLEGTSAGWVRSLVVVPMSVRDELVGFISFGYSAPGGPTPDQISIVQSVAGQAAVAVDNARLFEETQRRARESRALLGTAKAIVSTLELQPLMELVLDELRNVIPYDGAGVTLREGDYFSQLAVRRPSDQSARLSPPLRIDAGGELIAKILAGESVVIDDVGDDTEYARSFRNAWGGSTEGSPVAYVRSWLGVPLVSRDTVIGMLTIVKSDPAFFRDEHAAIGRLFAGQAAAAIENARLFEETQRRERELAALLEVSRAIASTLDVGEVLSAILDQLGAVTEHTGASILLFRDDAMEFVGARSITGVRAETGARIPFDAAPSLAAAMRQGETVIIDDVRADEPLAADYRAAIASMGVSDRRPFNVIRSWMAVPLTLKDRVLGSLTISWTEPSYFTEDHARLARAFADQAAAAMDNARLFEETRRRARETEALLDVSGAIVSTLDIDQLMNVILEKAGGIVERTGTAIVTLQGDELVIWDATTGGGPAEAQRGARIPLTISGPLWKPITRGDSIIIPDIRADEPMANALRASIEHIGLLDEIPFSAMRSWMGVPLSAKGNVFGILTTSMNEPDYFTDEHARLIGAFANQAAVAIENARLYEEAQQTASLEERQRLARELHDSVSQALYGIALGARTARTLLDRDPAKATEPVEYVLSLAEAGLTEMRALIFELRPESLESEGLVAAVQRHAAAVEARHGLQVTCHECQEPDAPLPVKEAAYRIVQEALTNTVKHAGANQVTVTIESVPGKVMLSVTDDGAGFDPAGEFPGHLGLKSMRERALKLGGDLVIESEPGKGTRVSGWLPVPAR
jgi:GAF domain-containing protein